MPKEATDRRVKAFEGAATNPEHTKFLNGINAYPFYLPPDKIARFLDERQAIARKLMDKTGILKK